jgi:hypothetical protein
MFPNYTIQVTATLIALVFFTLLTVCKRFQPWEDWLLGTKWMRSSVMGGSWIILVNVDRNRMMI